MTENLFIPGSMAHLTLEAEKYPDILYLISPKDSFSPVQIICKPNYNIDKVKEFIDDNFTVTMNYEIIVENDIGEL